MPAPRYESEQSVGERSPEALAARPLAQAMVEPRDDRLHVHIEVVAGNEIGAEKALPFEGKPMNRGEHGADSAANLNQGVRRQIRRQRVEPLAFDPLHERERQAEVGSASPLARTAGTGTLRRRMTSSAISFAACCWIALPIAQQDRAGAFRAEQLQPEIGVGEAAEGPLHLDDFGFRKGPAGQRLDARPARLENRLRAAPFLTQRLRSAASISSHLCSLSLPRFAPSVGIVAGFFREADRHAGQIEGLAQPVDEEALVALRDVVELIAEQHEVTAAAPSAASCSGFSRAGRTRRAAASSR